jgi:hypothetical protein
VGLCVGLAGCHGKPAAVPAPVAGPAPASGSDAGPADALVHLDADMLERFLRYEETTARTDAAASRRALELTAHWDGGTMLEGKPLAEGLALVRQQRDARQRALTASGMSERDVREIEQMVTELLHQRLSTPSDPGALEKEMQAAMAQAAPDRRPAFEEALGQLRQRAAQSADLRGLRQRWGDANMAVLLEHEDVLRRRWNALTLLEEKK